MAFEYMDADLAGVLQTPVTLNEAHVKCIMKQIVRRICDVFSFFFF